MGLWIDDDGQWKIRERRWVSEWERKEQGKGMEERKGEAKNGNPKRDIRPKKNYGFQVEIVAFPSL